MGVTVQSYLCSKFQEGSIFVILAFKTISFKKKRQTKVIKPRSKTDLNHLLMYPNKDNERTMR